MKTKLSPQQEAALEAFLRDKAQAKSPRRRNRAQELHLARLARVHESAWPTTDDAEECQLLGACIEVCITFPAAPEYPSKPGVSMAAAKADMRVRYYRARLPGGDQ